MRNTSQEEIHTTGISDPWEKCCDRALQTAHIPRAYKTSSINRTRNKTTCAFYASQVSRSLSVYSKPTSNYNNIEERQRLLGCLTLTIWVRRNVNWFY